MRRLFGRTTWKHEGETDPIANSIITNSDPVNTADPAGKPTEVGGSDPKGGDGAGGTALPDGHPKWLAGYPKEHWDALKGYEKPGDFAAKAIEAMENSGIAAPAEDATDEQLSAFYKSIGSPEKVEDFADAEVGLKFDQTPYKNAALKANLRKDQYAVYQKALIEGLNETMVAANGKREALAKEAGEELKKTYGDRFDSLTATLNQSIEKVAPGFTATSDFELYKSSAGFQKMAYKLAELLSDDGIPNSSGGSTSKGKKGYTFPNTPGM